MFINRADELEMLDERWDSDRGEYLVIYGRRRVGKSHLLSHWSRRDKKGIFYEATSGTASDNLADISREIAEFTGRADHAAQPFTSWRAVFAAFEEIIASEQIYLILDEFQFIARGDREIGSLINRLVQKFADNPNFFFVISGSDVSFFADEIMGYGATSYGRRTGSLELQPFRFKHAREFVPGFSVEDQIRSYSVFGGMPYYLVDVAGHGSLEEAIYREVLIPGAKLREEPKFLLSQESKIRDSDAYFSTLRAIANGKTTPNEISQHIQKENKSVRNFIDALIEIGLVERRYPVTHVTGKKFHLGIKDPFLRFWFEFVAPFESRLVDREKAKAHLEKTIMPGLDKFVSVPGFEEVCRQWTETHFDNVGSIGSWWGSIRETEGGERRNKAYEVDVAGIDASGIPVVLGSCKWTSSSHPGAELKKLKTVRSHLEAPDAHLLFFSRNRVDDSIEVAASDSPNIRIVSVSEL